MKIVYEAHPAATLFPMMDAEAFAALKADIKEHGQRECVVLFENQILDGRNRYQACEELGIECEFGELEECDDPVAYVVSHNLHRRHLTTSQRAEIAAKLATAGRGGDRKSEKIKGSNDPLKIEDAAKLLNVSTASVKRAKAKGRQKSKSHKSTSPDNARDKAAKLVGVSGEVVDQASVVLAKGTPELVASVDRGDIPMSLAVKIAVLPAEQQAKEVEKSSAIKSPPKLSIAFPPGIAGAMMGIMTDGSTSSVLGEIMLTLEREFKADDDFGNPIEQASADTLIEWKDFLQRISDLVEDAILDIDGRLDAFGDDDGGDEA